jgi:putative intracellular protease/amidase
MNYVRYFAFLISLCISAMAGAAVGSKPEQIPAKVAVLVFDNAENIDFTGPMQVFDVAGFEVFTVAANRTPVAISGGMKVVPQYTFSDAPQADIVVVPGGGVDDVMMDPATLAWIKAQSGGARHVMSVCNGAFILAHTGLLDGMTATTTSGNVSALRHHSAATKVVRNRRVVDNGKIVTTGGLSAGIDGALHLVSKLRGNGQAHYVAQMLEYDWRPDGAYVPATYALHLLPMYLDQKLAKFARVDEVAGSAGNARGWRMSFVLTPVTSQAELIAQIADLLSTRGNWGKPTSSTAQRRQWEFRDDEGRAWTSSINIAHANDVQQLLTIAVKRR